MFPKEMISAFLGNLIAASVLAVIMFLVLSFLFSGGRLGAFLRGIGRVLASTVMAPFKFMRRSVAAVSDHGESGDRALEGSEQYLLNKLMMLLQAGVIVASIGGLSAGLVMTWKTLLPPEHLRDQISSLKKEIREQERIQSNATERLQVLDKEWEQKRVVTFEQARAALAEAARAAGEAVSEVEQQIAGDAALAPFLSDLQGYAPRRDGGELDRGDIDRAGRRLSTRVDSYYWIADDARNTLRKWTDAWRGLALAEIELRELTEDVARARLQADWRENFEAKRSSEESLTHLNERLTTTREAAKFRFKPAALQLVLSLVGFIALIWVLGLMVESLWMGIRLAGDVHELRRQSDGGVRASS